MMATERDKESVSRTDTKTTSSTTTLAVGILLALTTSVLVDYSPVSLCACQLGLFQTSANVSNYDKPNSKIGAYAQSNDVCPQKREATEGDSAPVGHLQPLGSHREPSVSIEELDFSPSSEDFYREFLLKRKPVLLRGAAKDWPAYQRWWDKDYVRMRFGGELLKVEDRKFFLNTPPVKKIMNLTSFLDLYEAEQLYMDSPFFHTALPEDMRVPSSLSCPELQQTVSQTPWKLKLPQWQWKTNDVMVIGKDAWHSMITAWCHRQRHVF